MKKYLIIETFPNTPHIETSIEVALRLNKKGNQVFFFWSGYELPWKDWELPWYKKILLFSFENKIKNIKEFLKKKNINIVPDQNLKPESIKYIDDEITKLKNIKKLKDFKYKKDFSIGLACLSSLISKFHSINNFNNFKEEIPRALKAGCIIYERAIKVINEINPDEVITFNSRFVISRPIIDAAKKLKKKIIIHERGSSPKKYMLHNNDIFDKVYYSELIKSHWNKNKKLSKLQKIKIAKKYFSLILEKKFFKSRGLHFESKSINKVSCTKNTKIITFFCSTDHEYSSLSLQQNKQSFYINNKWKNQISAIKSLIKIIKKDKNKFLFIKAHPNFSKKSSIEYELKKLESLNVKYLSNSQKVDSIHLLKNSDIIVTFGSTLELTAKYLDKKVIPMFKHLYSPLGLFNYPKDEHSLKNMIYKKNSNIKNSKEILNKIAYFFMTFGSDYKYFKPIGFFRGNLTEKNINHFGPIINFLIKLKIIKY